MDQAQSFEEWFGSASAYLYIVAYNNLPEHYRTPENAGEVVALVMAEFAVLSEGFTKFPVGQQDKWRRLPNDGTVVPLKGWAAFYTRNRARNWGRRREVNMPEDFEWNDAVEAPDSPLVDVFREEMRATTRNCVAALPPPHDQIWALRYFAKKTHDEIADALKITKNRVNHSLKDPKNKAAIVRCLIRSGFDSSEGGA